MMLNQCTKDFQSLIDKLELLRAYENADENKRYDILLIIWMAQVQCAFALMMYHFICCTFSACAKLVLSI
jgi:S phase cyclin A-associated protein in the endoplasmic reticulum